MPGIETARTASIARRLPLSDVSRGTRQIRVRPVSASVMKITLAANARPYGSATVTHWVPRSPPKSTRYGWRLLSRCR